MPARNPFEQAMNDIGPALDRPRMPPRNLLADVFLSQVMERLDDALTHGYVPGKVTGHTAALPSVFDAMDPFAAAELGTGAHPRGREMNGLPAGPGFGGMRATYDPYPWDVHDMRRAPGTPLGGYGRREFDQWGWRASGAAPAAGPIGFPSMPRPPEASLWSDAASGDPFALPLDDPLADPGATFERDLADPFAANGDMPQYDPLAMADATVAPFADPSGALAAFSRTVRPGLADIGRAGYQPPVGSADPYGNDLRLYLRRLLRAV